MNARTAGLCGSSGTAAQRAKGAACPSAPKARPAPAHRYRRPRFLAAIARAERDD